ncbi:hypothetical protein GCM10027082_24680 [Comamonas humi]
MYVLDPKTIGDASFLAGSIPAVDAAAGEVAWVSGAAVAKEDERVYGRSIYKCAAVPPNLATPPDQDPTSWQLVRPSNRWAPFDTYVQTAQVNRNGSLTYVLKIPFADGLDLQGLKGSRLQISVTDGVGGPDLIPPIDTRLNLPRIGWWNYFFGQRTPIKAYRLDGIPRRSGAVFTITVSADPAVPVGIGWMSIGTWTAYGMTSVNVRSGTQYGAQAEIVNYSFRKEFEDGTFRLVPRGSAVNLTMTVAIDAADSNRFFSLIERLKDTPVSVYASSLGRDRFMSTVGFISVGWQRNIGPVTNMNVNVKGVV